MRRFIFCIAVLSFFDCFAQNKKQIVKTYFPNGKVKSITEVENGKKNGKEEIYWGNGNLFMVQYFKDDLLVDSSFQYQKDKANVLVLKGYCISKSHLVILDTLNRIAGENDYKEGMINDGPVYIYYKNGNVASIGNYKEGKKNGPDITYFQNGNIYKIIHYKNGVKVPPSIEFDSTGKMINYIPL